MALRREEDNARDKARWTQRALSQISTSNHHTTLPVFEAKETSIMNLTKNPGRLLMGIWLIVTGLLLMVSIPIPARTKKEA